MSEVKPNLPTREVIRNDVKVICELGTFGKKSPRAGMTYPFPEIKETPESLAELIKFIGIEDTVQALRKWMKSTFQGIFSDNTDETTGITDWEKWEIDAKEFTAGVDKMDDLLEDLEELQDAQAACVQDENFGATQDGTDDVKTPEAIVLEEKLRGIQKQIKPIKIKLAALKIRNAAAAEKRKQKKLEKAQLVAKQEAQLAAEKEAATE
jgi:hypothetical protein